MRRSLLPLEGQILRKISVLDGHLRYRVSPNLVKKMQGEKLKGIFRLGKYLRFEFSSDVLLFHLGMTGRMLIGQRKKSPYAKVLFHFNKDRLDFIDVRRFGFILSGAAARTALPRGEDALALADTESLAMRILASKASVKSLLLDQKLIAGLGNIYVSEILFVAKVHPAKRGIDLVADDIRRILTAVLKVLKRAIAAKGSSISDFVYALPGDKEFSTGNYQNKFLVYSRDGAACKVCKAKIEKIVQGARSSYFCPRCQPHPAYGHPPHQSAGGLLANG